MAKIKDPGFGYKSNQKIDRMVNDDGSFNMQHVNKKFSVSELYSHLISMSWVKFFIYILIGYIVLNLCFALIFFNLGINQLSVSPTNNSINDFLTAFYFSTQTLTTLGYGTISPIGHAASLFAALEALVGLLCFSFFTGLLYGRFSKPKAAIRFSDALILRPFNTSNALMFRLMNKRNNIMIKPEISVTMSLNYINEEGQSNLKFFRLKLERSEIMYLPTTWTIVHEIDSDSPLFGYSFDKIKALNAELFILINYYEDSFAQQVYQIHSYNFNQIELNKKFTPAFYFNENGTPILDHDKLNQLEPCEV